MKITKSTIEHVANLARLNLTEQEKDKYTTDLENILHYVDKLNQLDTQGIAPTSHSIPMKNVLREDIVNESTNREKILSNAPSQIFGCYSVPKVVD